MQTWVFSIPPFPDEAFSSSGSLLHGTTTSNHIWLSYQVDRQLGQMWSEGGTGEVAEGIFFSPLPSLSFPSLTAPTATKALHQQSAQLGASPNDWSIQAPSISPLQVCQTICL